MDGGRGFMRPYPLHGKMGMQKSEEFFCARRVIATGPHPAETSARGHRMNGHAVLVVRTDRGDFVLDNMRNKVLLWSDTEYTFLKMQSSRHAAQWVKIDDNHSPALGSL